MNSPGLRERKKQKTRWAIQEHALRLIAEQGYDATTVDQIAAAAEISPSTFFRYFKTKEDLIVSDQYDAIVEAGLAHLDPATPPLEAIRTVFMSVLTTVPPEEGRKLRERTRLILSIPALRARSLENLQETIDLLAKGVAARTGRPANSLEVRVFAGAIVGAMVSIMELWVDNEDLQLGDLLDQTLTLIAAGLPL